MDEALSKAPVLALAMSMDVLYQMEIESAGTLLLASVSEQIADLGKHFHTFFCSFSDAFLATI